MTIVEEDKFTFKFLRDAKLIYESFVFVLFIPDISIYTIVYDMKLFSRDPVELVYHSFCIFRDTDQMSIRKPKDDLFESLVESSTVRFVAFS